MHCLVKATACAVAPDGAFAVHIRVLDQGQAGCDALFTS